MPLPPELFEDLVPDSVAVVGDIDALISEIELGISYEGWRIRIAERWQEMETLF